MRTYIFSGKARAVGNLGIGGATCSIQFYLTRILGKKTKQCHNALSIRLFSFAASTAGKVSLKKVKLYLYVVPKCICKLGVTCFKCVCNKVGVEQLHSVTILTLMAVREGEGGTSGEIVSRTFSLKMITKMR